MYSEVIGTVTVYEIFIVVKFHVVMFWVETPCSLVDAVFHCDKPISAVEGV